MKILTNLFSLALCIGWTVFILLSYVAFKDEKANALITMKDSLREAINIDYQERLNKILIHYRPLGRKVKGVQIEYGDSLEIIYFEDSTHESLATQLANQYVMTRIIPVNPDNLNKIFQEEWEKNGVSAAKTGIIYRYNKKKVFSDNDSISFQKALVTPVQAIDAKRTAGVTGMGYDSLDRNSKTYYSKSVMEHHRLFHRLGMGVFVISEKPLEKDIPASQNCTRFEKMVFKAGKSEIVYQRPAVSHSTCGFQSAVTIHQCTGTFLTKEDIKNVFWPQEDKPDNKIHNHISTLKSSIKNFSEYQIITEPKKGYRLVISSNG